MRLLTRRRVSIAGAAFVAAYGVWQAWLWWLRNEPLDRAAERVVQAIQDFDTGTLWDYTFTGDRDGHGISRQHFDRLITTYVASQVRRLNKSRSSGLWTNEGKAFERTQVFVDQGREVMFDFVLFRTPDGPRGYLISPCVVFAMSAKFGAKHRSVAGNKRLWRTLYDGISADRQLLESMGVHGHLDASPGHEMTPWSRMLETYSRYRD